MSGMISIPVSCPAGSRNYVVKASFEFIDPETDQIAQIVNITTRVSQAHVTSPVIREDQDDVESRPIVCRPHKFKHYKEKIIGLLHEGKTLSEVARVLNLPRGSIYSWSSKHKLMNKLETGPLKLKPIAQVSHEGTVTIIQRGSEAPKSAVLG